MKQIQRIYTSLCTSSKKNKKQVFNYTIPQSWNTFGYSQGTLLRNGEMIVNPYAYSCFGLEKIMEEIKQNPSEATPLRKDGSWLKKQVLYFGDICTMGSWDHDRDDTIDKENLYNLNDQGTFLKAILLLPLLKRAGITSIVMPNIIATQTTKEAHDYADFHAVYDTSKLDQHYFDPLVSDCTLEEQFQAFIDAAHGLGISILLGIAPALMARDNAFVAQHPEWFYWIQKKNLATYATPYVEGLPKNCEASEKVCQILYASESGKAHINAFVPTPKITKEKDLKTIETQLEITTAPMISDQINASLPSQRDLTMVRFYEDGTIFSETDIPCLLQDQVRMDMYPGNTIMESLWTHLISAYQAWMDTYAIDGFYLMSPYMLPNDFIKKLVTTLRKQKSDVAFLVEHTNMYDTQNLETLGIDAITGSSAYTIHDVMAHQYHNFTYSLRQFTLPLCGASEFLDTPRIVQYEGGEALAKVISIMNLFLPNVIPTYMGGQLAFEKQPQYLSPFANQGYLEAHDRSNPHYHKQAMLDHYTYDYTRKDFHVFINQLEKFSTIRMNYLDAITNVNRCIPVWFDDPNDAGIGYTYYLENNAILVVCNTNIHEAIDLRIHTENMLWQLPFAWTSIHQIFTTHDPYIHEVQLDNFQMLQLHFEIGEVKIFEFS